MTWDELNKSVGSQNKTSTKKSGWDVLNKEASDRQAKRLESQKPSRPIISVAPKTPQPRISVAKPQQRPSVRVAQPQQRPTMRVAQPTPQPSMRVAPPTMTPEQAARNIYQSPRAKSRDIIGMGAGPLRPDVAMKVSEQAMGGRPTISQAKQPIPEQKIKDVINLTANARDNYLRQKEQKETLASRGVNKGKAMELAPETKSGVSSFVDALRRGFFYETRQTIGTLAETAQISPEMVKWGKSLTDNVEAELLRKPELLPAKEQNISTFIGESLGGMIPYFTQVAIGSMIGGPAGGIAVGAMAEKTSAYQEYIDQGMSPSQANDISSYYGLIASGIENMMGIKPANIGGQLLNKEVTQIFKGSFLKFAKKELPKIGWKTVKTALEEGTEEAIQGIAQQIGLKYFDEHANIFEGMAENFAGGAVGGLFLGGAGKAVQTARTTKLQKPEPTYKPLFAKKPIEVLKEEPKIAPQKPKTAITAPKQAEVVKSTPEVKKPVTEPLIQEATKYKTADEFVKKADLQKVYHGSKVSDIIEKEGFKLLPSKQRNMASAYGDGIYLTTSKADAKGWGGLVEARIPKDLKLKKAFDSDAFKIDTKKLIKDGYDGVIIDRFNTEHIIIFDPNKLKTKSQLTDIWNKAQEKPVKKVVKPTPKVEKTGGDINNFIKGSTEYGKIEKGNSIIQDYLDGFRGKNNNFLDKTNIEPKLVGSQGAFINNKLRQDYILTNGKTVKSQLKEIWNKAQEKPVVKEKVVVKEKPVIKKKKEVISTERKRKIALQKPVKYGTGKIKESKLFNRLTKQLTDSGVAKYEAMELVENRLRAKEFVKANPKKAFRIAKGLDSTPEGVTLATLTDEVYQSLVNTNKLKEAISIAKKQSLRGTRAGQEIVSLKEIYRNNSSANYVNQLLSLRAKKKLDIKYDDKKPKPYKKLRDNSTRVKKIIDKKASKIQSAQEIINSILCQ